MGGILLSGRKFGIWDILPKSIIAEKSQNLFNILGQQKPHVDKSFAILILFIWKDKAIDITSKKSSWAHIFIHKSYNDMVDNILK